MLIIGKPTTGPWALSLTVCCPCGFSFLWMGQPGPGTGEPGTIMPCPSCERRYTLMDFPTHERSAEGVVEVRWKLLHTPAKASYVPSPKG